jgi:hypothetical protein
LPEIQWLCPVCVCATRPSNTTLPVRAACVISGRGDLLCVWCLQETGSNQRRLVCGLRWAKGLRDLCVGACAACAVLCVLLPAVSSHAGGD